MGARLLAAVAVLAAGLALSAGRPAADASRGAAGYPLTLRNCGRSVTVPAPPQRVVTMNEGATELMLELGLGRRLVGTAYLDDAHVYPPLAKAYARVPVLAKEYPSSEVVLAARPDLVYASYASAFAGSAAGSRDRLASEGIPSYLSPSDCKERTAPITFDDVYAEIRQLGRLFAVPARAERLIARLQRRVEAARALAAANGAAGLEVFWYDSGAKTPYVGGCCGAPGLIVRSAGARNIFDGIPNGWGDGSWERVLAADPDVIVLVDAVWDTAADKRRQLARSPYSGLTAVQRRRFVVIPFGSTTPSFRDVDAVEALARALARAHR